jgi:hypothetical protein
VQLLQHSMEVGAAVFGAGTSIWDAQRIESLQPLQAKIFADAIDAMGVLSAEVKLYSVKIALCCTASGLLSWLCQQIMARSVIPN